MIWCKTQLLWSKQNKIHWAGGWGLWDIWKRSATFYSEDASRSSHEKNTYTHFCNAISSMKLPIHSWIYTSRLIRTFYMRKWRGYIYNILYMYHQQIYIFFQTCLCAYYKMVRFLQQEKVLWFFPGAHSSVRVDCLSRKISRPQAVNEYSQGGMQATVLAPGAHACMFLY